MLFKVAIGPTGNRSTIGQTSMWSNDGFDFFHVGEETLGGIEVVIEFEGECLL